MLCVVLLRLSGLYFSSQCLAQSLSIMLPSPSLRTRIGADKGRQQIPTTRWNSYEGMVNAQYITTTSFRSSSLFVHSSQYTHPLTIPIRNPRSHSRGWRDSRDPADQCARILYLLFVDPLAVWSTICHIWPYYGNKYGHNLAI